MTRLTIFHEKYVIFRILVNLIFFLLFPKDNASYEDMMDGTINHIKAFFADNSTLMTSLDAARANITNVLTNSLQNYSLMEALNKTIQETIL